MGCRGGLIASSGIGTGCPWAAATALYLRRRIGNSGEKGALMKYAIIIPDGCAD